MCEVFIIYINILMIILCYYGNYCNNNINLKSIYFVLNIIDFASSTYFLVFIKHVWEFEWFLISSVNAISVGWIFKYIAYSARIVYFGFNYIFFVYML